MASGNGILPASCLLDAITTKQREAATQRDIRAQESSGRRLKTSLGPHFATLPWPPSAGCRCPTPPCAGRHRCQRGTTADGGKSSCLLLDQTAADIGSALLTPPVRGRGCAHQAHPPSRGGLSHGLRRVGRAPTHFKEATLQVS